MEEKKLNELREKILENSWKEMSNDLAREYFYALGLTLEDVNIKNVDILKNMMQKEISILLADETYSMIPNLQMNSKIINNKSGIFLYTDGYYFDKREAICFRYYDGYPHYTEKQKLEKEIYFCNWASGCNRIPYIKGFIEWCDWMVKESKK